MDSINFKELYKLQDKVLSAVFNIENEFYLTGGTCLHRFYLQKRYSDDLDFFTNHSLRFNIAAKKIRLELQKYFNVGVIVESKDFNRYIINNTLQVDFVNDVSVRCNDVVISKEGYILDTVENILSNKLTSIVGRDEPKDIFDIFMIYKYLKVNWKNVLKCAHQKAYFGNEELLIRLKTFPKKLIKKLSILDEEFLKDFESGYLDLIKCIEIKIDE